MSGNVVRSRDCGSSRTNPPVLFQDLMRFSCCDIGNKPQLQCVRCVLGPFLSEVMRASDGSMWIRVCVCDISETAFTPLMPKLNY